MEQLSGLFPSLEKRNGSSQSLVLTAEVLQAARLNQPVGSWKSMKLDILLLSGNQAIKTGQIFWCQGDGHWSFEAEDEKVLSKLREIDQSGEVMIRRAIHGEDFIADGFEMIGPGHNEFLLALEDELGTVGVLELRAVGKS